MAVTSLSTVMDIDLSLREKQLRESERVKTMPIANNPCEKRT